MSKSNNPVRRLIVLGAASALMLVAGAALAQDATDPGGMIVGLVCSHPTTVAAALTFLLIHAGCSGASLYIKKVAGYASSPLGQFIVKAIRIGAADGKPSPDVIVHEAAVAVQNSPAARATGADPTLMVKAADAIKNEPAKA